ncbi:MAG: methyltransferase domain-containing protein [Phycisphaerae bacterium]|jgi:SAM-dependent methyltransferase
MSEDIRMNHKFAEILLCPSCGKSGLTRLQNQYICDLCKVKYSDYEGIPAVLTEDFRKDKYNKMIVLTDNRKHWKRQAVWGNQIDGIIPDGSGFFLDLACGGGRKDWIESKGYSYIGLDYYLDYGTNLLANSMNIPFKDNTISVCSSISAMEHFPDPWSACNEIFRVIKPGGLYIGSVAFLQPFHERSYYHMTHLGVKYMLKKSGFTIEQIIPFKKNGFSFLIERLLIIKQPVSFLADLVFNAIMFLRKIGARFISRFYRKNEAKSHRISQFIAEEKIRFTSGFIYIARKPEK